MCIPIFLFLAGLNFLTFKKVMKTADSLYTSQTVTGVDKVFQGYPGRVGFVEETE